MYYSHPQSSQPTASSSKQHDVAPGQGPGAPPNGLGVWGRHPFAPPGGPGGPGGGLPIPSGGYGAPGGPGPGSGPNGAGANGILGFPPGPHHPGHGPHHGSFGGGAGGLHMGGNGGGGIGMGYGMGLFGAPGGQPNGNGVLGSSPPRPAESNVPLTPFWQHQLLRYEAARSSSTPHHRARSLAAATRMTNKSSAVTIADPNSSLAPATLNGLHRKTTSLSTALNGSDRSQTPPVSEGGNLAMSNGDPADPLAPPAPTTKEDEDSHSEPWSGIDLGGVKLRNLSPSLFAFHHLTELYINHNALTSIPSSISVLRHLTTLDATGNELSSIPPEIGYLFKLKELLLFDNRLTSLPYELGNLHLLEMLGIEGNPLDEKLKNLLAEGGTSAVITQLRDEAPEPPAPPQRHWIHTDNSVSDGDGKQEGFTVLTYNILCHSFAPSTAYKYTPAWALDWNYRKTVILDELVNASAEIVCLQEIDGEQFADFFHPQLKQHGYEGCHYSRSRARTMSHDEAIKVDGCAMFWKADRFNLIETQVIEFNQVALKKLDTRTDDMFNRVMSRDNISIVAFLELKASGARLMAVNAHIYWDHRYRDVKLVQIGMLVEEMEKAVEEFSKWPSRLQVDEQYNNGKSYAYDPSIKGKDIPLVLCVDLNSTLDSAVYDLLATGEVPPDHEDFMSHGYGTYTAKGVAHGLDLRSVCASFGGMRMTNHTPTFKEAIDYIFFSPKNLQVLSVLGDVDQAYLDRTVGFPNAHFPSDHIPVFAQLRIKGKPDKDRASNDKSGRLFGR